MIFFFFNDTATTEIYTLSLHDALPICPDRVEARADRSRQLTVIDPLGRELLQSVGAAVFNVRVALSARGWAVARSEEHTSELQSRQYLVCRLLLEKKKPPSNAHVI